MSSNEISLPPLSQFTEMLIGKEKKNNEHANSTQSTLTKPPPGAKIIGSYLLGRNIGIGTFGKVYLAMHIPTSQKVAIKAIEKKMDPIDVKRVKHEIQILKTIRHRHIVNLYEIIQTEKSVILVTEYLPKGELFQHIIKQKKIRQTEACAFFQQIISAVQYLHRNKIAHRDLKPQNILLDSDNQLKLIDFGLGSFYSKNQLSTFCGSPCYAAPEMIAAKKHYNPLSADLWSCGIILFSMLCGHLPFCDANTKSLYKKILNCSYKVPTHVSPEAESLIQGLLTLNPSKRLSIKQIQKHKWFNLVSPKPAYGLNVGDFLPTESELLYGLTSMGIKAQSVRSGIAKNEKNKDTAAYHILMKKKVRGGDLFPSYLGDDNFNPKLIERAERKGMEEQTESLNSPQNPIIIIQSSPDAPEVPMQEDANQAGWWYEDHTEDEIRQIDHAELTMFAQNILDVVISKFTLKPSIEKIHEIFENQELSQKTIKLNLQQTRGQKFYTDITHKNKVRNFHEIDRGSTKNIRESIHSINKTFELSSANKETRKFNLKKLASLQIPEKKILIKRTFSRKKSVEMSELFALPKLSRKTDTKLELKINNLQKLYGVKTKAPSRVLYKMV